MDQPGQRPLLSLERMAIWVATKTLVFYSSHTINNVSTLSTKSIKEVFKVVLAWYSPNTLSNMVHGLVFNIIT